MFCRSRPFDQQSCVLGNPDNCKLRPIIKNGNCATMHVVYDVTCELCLETLLFYDGETDRPSNHRFGNILEQRTTLLAIQIQCFSQTLFITSQGLSG